MPKKTTRKSSKLSPFELSIFTNNKQVLNLIIVAFLALSCLLVLTVISQGKELSFYRTAKAVYQSK